MENKNNSTVLVLLSLIIGLIIGYFFGINANSGLFMDSMHGNYQGHMQDENHGHEYENEIVRQDGAMMHAMDEMMVGLRGKTGQEYEEAFLKGMIVHHLGAVKMAEDLLEQTDRPELVSFANDIISVQSDEIEAMETWLEDWFNNDEN